MTGNTARGSSASGRIAVSIVNYGTSALVLRAMPALLRQLETLDNAHVVVVDNASPDDDGVRLEAGLRAFGAAERIAFVQSPVNGGFAAGNNIAFARIRELPWTPDAVFLLNPDAEPRPGAIAEMLRLMNAKPLAGFVGPRLENPDGSTWSGAFRFPTIASEVLGVVGIGWLYHRVSIVLPERDTPMQADWLSGAALLIRWSALEALGNMDEGYFLYFEETDYMRRGRERGWECWHAPRAHVLHDAGAATGITTLQTPGRRMPAYWFQSWARYHAKNHGALRARITAGLKLGALLLCELQLWLRGKPGNPTKRFARDFATEVVFARLSPPPASMRSRPKIKPDLHSATGP